jgi:hypothetical protein
MYIYLFISTEETNQTLALTVKMTYKLLINCQEAVANASHMQTFIQIYPCLLKLSCKQDTILKISDFSTKTYDFPQKTLASNISMLEPIQDNDNYKPHAKNYSNLSMFSKVIVF